LHKIARSQKDGLLDAIVETFSEEDMEGAYSMLFLTNRSLIAVRDPQGFRPMCIGKLEDAWVVASETCALELIDAEYERDIEPGEIIVINRNGPRTVHNMAPRGHRHCVFEHVYFARPDSLVFGQSVNESRHKMGKALAIEHPCPTANIVVPVPDSGMVAAAGFAQESGLRLRPTGLVRNHYIGRTFIDPDPRIRDLSIKLKLSPTRDLLDGQKVVLVDDSIVRGNTLSKIVGMMKHAGAKEVHVRIACPPTISPCYYGVDTPDRSHLIAANKTQDEIRETIHADSLGYLSLEGMLQACRKEHSPLDWCTACYSGVYPLEVRIGAKTKAEREINC
jgi:amidophosphoribosyltransferase